MQILTSGPHISTCKFLLLLDDKGKGAREERLTLRTEPDDFYPSATTCILGLARLLTPDQSLDVAILGARQRVVTL